MQIQLTNIYRITGDNRQYILQRLQRNRWINWSFSTDLEVLLKDFIEMNKRLSDVKTIQELIDYQKELVTALNKALQPLKIEVISKE